MLNRIIRLWRPRRRPWRERLTIGEVAVSSGCLLLADPMYIANPVVVEGVPAGRHPVTADVIHYPECTKVARVALRFAPGKDDPARQLATLPIDSAKMVVIDREDYNRYWTETGPDRLGVVCTARDWKMVDLLKKHFNLDCVPVHAAQADVVQPIPPDLENRIEALLKSIPEYADFPFIHFHVQTNNTFERVNCTGEAWRMIVIDQQTGTSLLTASTGNGDGVYPVYGHFAGQRLTGLEIPFMEPG